MKFSWKDLFLSAIASVFIGFLWSLIVCTFLADSSGGLYSYATPALIAQMGSSLAATWLQTILLFIAGCICYFSDFLFEKENWGWAKALFLHYILIFGTYLLCAYLCYWMPREFGPFLTFFLIFSAIYLVIAFIQYRRVSRFVETANEKTQKTKE